MKWPSAVLLVASSVLGGHGLAGAVALSVRLGASQPYEYPASEDRTRSVAVDGPTFWGSIRGLFPAWGASHILAGVSYLGQSGRYSGILIDDPPPDITTRTLLLSIGARLPLTPTERRVAHYFDVEGCVGFLHTEVQEGVNSEIGSSESVTNISPGVLLGWTTRVALNPSLGLELGVAYLFTASFDNDEGLPGWPEFGGMRQLLFSGGVRFGAS